MEKIIKQSLFLILLSAALVLAFQAGEMGVSRSSRATQKDKLFKSLPELTQEMLSTMTAEDETDAVVPEQTQELTSEGTSEKVTAKDEEKKNKIERSNRSKPEKSIKKNKKSRPLSLGSTRFVYISMVQGEKPSGEKEAAKAGSERKQDLPQLSELLVPVFEGAQLKPEVDQELQAQLPSLHAKGNIFVINKALSQNEGKRVYEILVFDSKGENLLGTFKSQSTFPFQGIPTLEKVDPKTFPEISGYIAMDDHQGKLQDILKDEDHIISILTQAYVAPSIEGTFVGRDPAMSVDLYSVFPGIYFAQSLR